MNRATAVILQETMKHAQTMKHNIATKLSIGLLTAIVAIDAARTVVRAKKAEGETRKAQSAASEAKPR